MPRFIVLILFFFLPVLPVFAQNDLTPTPVLQESQQSLQTLGFLDFISNLFNLIKEKQVDKEVSTYRKKILPNALSEDASLIGIDITPTQLEVVTRDYANINLVNKDPADLNTFLASILAIFQNLFGQGIVDTGNDNASKFYEAKLPNGVGRDKLARLSRDKNLAMGNSNVLGTTYGVSDEAMAYAYDCSRCTGLPFGVCSCDKEPTPTPTPSPGGSVIVTPGDISNFPTTYPIPESNTYYTDTKKCRPYDYIKSPVTLPAICYELPTSFEKDSSISNGMCSIPDKGFCSPGCLKPFFGNDETMARKAAMICYKESGGQEKRVNKGCLNGISNEYSVGLFQINLKNEDSNNPWTKQPRSYQCRGTVISKGSISCDIGPNYDVCTEKFSIPEINIPEAWNLWYDRYIYYTSISNNDLCAVHGGGLQWIWKGWSVAYPPPVGYCDIKF